MNVSGCCRGAPLLRLQLGPESSSPPFRPLLQMRLARRICTAGQQLSRMALRCSSTAAAARVPAAAAAPLVQAALRRAAPAALAGAAGIRTGSLVQRLPLRALTVAAAAQPEQPAAAAAAAEEVRSGAAVWPSCMGHLVATGLIMP